MYYVSSRGLRKYIPNGSRLLKAKLGIDKAIKNNEIFHIWFHPVDFTDCTDQMLKEFEEILKYANKKRASEKLEIKRMNDIAYEIINKS